MSDPRDNAGAETVIAQFEAAAVACADGDQELLPERLCRAVADVLGVEGAAISVYMGDEIAVPVGANEAGAAVGEALQFSLREGPCLESYAEGRPVVVGDLREPGSEAWARWPTYTAQLIRRTPYHGVFTYPLHHRGSAFGSLSLYRRAAGTPAYLDDVPVIADRVATQLLLSEVFTGPDGESVHQWIGGPAGSRRRQVWVAVGMTVETNNVTPGQAIDLLRAQAFTADRLIDDIAADVVAGRVSVPVLGAP